MSLFIPDVSLLKCICSRKYPLYDVSYLTFAVIDGLGKMNSIKLHKCTLITDNQIEMLDMNGK